VKIVPSVGTRRLRSGLLLGVLLGFATGSFGQSSTVERKFPQSKARVEKALKVLEAEMSGRLPVVEGFAVAEEHPLSSYRRAYYQSTVQVEATASGGTIVRVSTKVTAWYADPAPAKSGYKVLASNGRLEGDLLDQLADQLGGAPSVDSATTALGSVPPSEKSSASASPVARPEAPSAEKRFPVTGPFSSSSSSLTQSLAAREGGLLKPAPAKIEDESDALRAEAASLEEVLKNQAHPDNIVAVKKSGTPIVDAPSLKAKTLFLASIHDEFELLDFTPDWVHVRISGLSRGWVWRNSLELPGSLPQGEAEGGPGPVAGADVFHVSKEETSPFPGDWKPLRGKKVKIISIEKDGDQNKEVELSVKLSFAKYLLQKSYDELARSPGEPLGVVLIFDSADGGMIAATFPSLEQWKAGKLSDSALWHQCFFDPPEAFISPASPGGQ
jgi:hypothetical protein